MLRPMPVEQMPPVRPPLVGRLVRLRAREEADLSRLNGMFNDPDVLAGLASVTFPQSMAGIRAWAAETRTAEDRLICVVETLRDPEAIGVCSLEGIDPRNRSAEFGVWIGKPYWGKGYGTDATRTICRFGFRHMNLQRIQLHVYPETNPRAVRAYEKVGFKHEGTLRRSHFLGGRYIDAAVMGLLAEELVE